MLAKILNADLSTITASTLSVVLTDSVGVPLDLTGQSIQADWFKLVKYIALASDITITSAVLGGTPTDGEIVLTFDGTADSVSIGNVIILTQGTVVPSAAPFDRLTNTASIDTGLGNLSIDGTNQFIIVPNHNTTKAKNYNLNINLLEDAGVDETATVQVVNLATPLTVNKVSIVSAKIEKITAGDSFDINAEFEFKVTFYSAADGLGEPLTFEADASDILSISFEPVV